jgi:hypothetical protein
MSNVRAPHLPLALQGCAAPVQVGQQARLLDDGLVTLVHRDPNLAPQLALATASCGNTRPTTARHAQAGVVHT